MKKTLKILNKNKLVLLHLFSTKFHKMQHKKSCKNLLITSRSLLWLVTHPSDNAHYVLGVCLESCRRMGPHPFDSAHCGLG